MRSTLFTILAFLLISNANADIEPNNNSTEATALSQGISVDGIQSDEDWYRIDVVAGKQILIDLTFTHADGNIDMELQKGGLTRAISESVSDHEFIDNNISITGAGTYYIKVYGADLDSNSYTLTWTVLTGTDDGFEPNDSNAATSAITEDEVNFGLQRNQDWYSINVTLGNRRVLASLRFTKIDNLDMVLRDTDGNPLASSIDLAAGVNEVIDFEVVTAGTYHLQITGDSSGDGYALDWAGIGVNEVPQAIANTVSTTENTPYNFMVSDFTFSDNEGDSLVSATLSGLSLGSGTLTHSSGTPVSDPDMLTAAQLDTLVYTPLADTTGSAVATFDFKVNDADPGTVSAQLAINVTAVTTTPVEGGSSSGALAPASLLVLLLTGLLRRKHC